jgi:hypothetical protein
MEKSLKVFLSILSLIVVIGLGVAIFRQPTENAFVGVPIGNDYHSTTTVKASGATNLRNYALLCSGNGSLGEITITGVGTGSFVLYDATSTKTNTEWATTTLAIIPASLAVGTYTFNSMVQKGVLIDYTGNIATSTITCRP